MISKYEFESLRDGFRERLKVASEPKERQRWQRMCELQCVSWKWATSDMFCIEPFRDEKVGISKGRWTRKLGKGFLHGLSADGRIRVIRETRLFPDATLTVDAFFRFEASLIESVRYEQHYVSKGNVEWHAAAIDEMLLDGAKSPVRYCRIGVGGFSVSYFNCNGSVVTAEDTCHEESMQRGWGRVFHSRTTYSYNSDGSLAKIVLSNLDHPQQDQVLYARPRPCADIRTLSGKIETRLFAEICDRVASYHFESPIYCILVVCDTENDMIPPILAIGQQHERVSLLGKWSRSSRYEVWDQLNYAGFNEASLNLDPADVSEEIQVFNSYIRATGDWRTAVRCLASVAKRLFGYFECQRERVTDDFVAAVVDLEGNWSMRTCLKRSVPAERIKLLESRELL